MAKFRFLMETYAGSRYNYEGTEEDVKRHIQINNNKVSIVKVEEEL